MTKTNTLTFVIMMMGVLIIGFILPWWAGSLWIVFIAFIRKTSMKHGIFMGAVSLAVVWGIMASYMSIHDSAGIINKTGELLGGIPGFLLFVMTIIVGMITGALSGWFGSALKKIVRT